MNGFLLRVAFLAATIGPLFAPMAAAQSSAYPDGMAPEPSAAAKFSSSVKNGFDKMAKALVPKSAKPEATDPISLSVPAKPTPDLHLAAARMAEQAGDLGRAEHHFREALALAPNHVDTLLAYAHMLDRQGKLTQATDLYQMAVQTQPRNATAHNDLGICYARQGKLNEAIASLGKAIELRPKQARYRNNIATVLVQANRVDEAFSHLTAVHSEAVAYYNMGYLLQKAGNMKGAARLFEEALRVNPSLKEARVWLEKIRPAAMSESARPPQVVARRPEMGVPRAGTSAPMPPAGSLEEIPSMTTSPTTAAPIPPIMTPSQTPGQLAPLPSINPLPPIERGY